MSKSRQEVVSDSRRKGFVAAAPPRVATVALGATIGLPVAAVAADADRRSSAWRWWRHRAENGIKFLKNKCATRGRRLAGSSTKSEQRRLAVRRLPSMPESHLRALFDDTLRLPASAIPYRIGAALREAFPSRALLETEHEDFDVFRFHRDGQCTLEWNEEVHCQRVAHWQRQDPHVTTEGKNAWWRVRWEAARISMSIIRAEWPRGFAPPDPPLGGGRLAGDRRAVLRRGVPRRCHYPRQELLVFNGGCWSRSHEMWAAVQKTSFDDLILAGALKDEIRGDLERFLRARDDYARYHVPWKRGILFVGPPGNGKTHCLRASIRLLDVPCLYVQSLATRHDTEDSCIRAVFRHARELTPCCSGLRGHRRDDHRGKSLVLLEPARRLRAERRHPHPGDHQPPRIASTRPSPIGRSRASDLQVPFWPPPGRAERHAYVMLWRGRLDTSMRMAESEEGRVMERLVAETDGFSFAYVKELFVSSMVRWMAGPRDVPIAPILFEQVTLLREQMRTEALPSPEVTPTDED